MRDSQGARYTGTWLLMYLCTCVVIILGPQLASPLYLNLASIEVMRGYVVAGTAARNAPSTLNLVAVPNALSWLDTALALNGASSAPWRQKGRALLLSGQPGEAETAFERAIQANPGDIIAQDTLAELHLAKGQLDRAVAEWRELRAASRLVALGQDLAGQERWAAATEAYRAAIEAVPGYVDAYYPFGWALYHQSGDAAGALATFLTAHKLAPSSAWPYVNVGDLHVAQGRIDEAIPWYWQARAVAPREPGLDTKLAWAYTAYGDQMRAARQWTRAAAAYRTALKIVPAYAEAQRGLAALAEIP